jgi:hypothetical protein
MISQSPSDVLRRARLKGLSIQFSLVLIFRVFLQNDAATGQ